MKIVNQPHYNDDVERVVNGPAAQRRAMTAKLVHKLLATVVAMLAVLLLNLVLWILNVTPSLLAVLLAVLSSWVTCFALGRLYEICFR